MKRQSGAVPSWLGILSACLIAAFGVSGISQAQESCGSGFHFLAGLVPDLELVRDEPPTSSSPATVDSPSLTLTGGNLYKSIGSWRVLVSGTPPGGCGVFTPGPPSPDAAHLWLGLRNSDDQGARFDLRAELYAGDTFVQAGEARCVAGLTRNPAKAKEVIIPFSLIHEASFSVDTELTLKILARMGTDPGGVCPGHASATGVRLYYDSVDQSSSVFITMQLRLPPPRD